MASDLAFMVVEGEVKGGCEVGRTSFLHVVHHLEWHKRYSMVTKNNKRNVIAQSKQSDLMFMLELIYPPDNHTIYRKHDSFSI